MTWAAAAQPDITSNNVLIAVVVGVLSAPFLNFLISLFRAKVDKNNIIVTGAGATVTSALEFAEDLREELATVKGELREEREARAKQEQRHFEEMAKVRAEHRAEIGQIRAEHRTEMVELRAQRDDMKRALRRVTEG